MCARAVRRAFSLPWLVGRFRGRALCPAGGAQEPVFRGDPHGRAEADQSATGRLVSRKLRKSDAARRATLAEPTGQLIAISARFRRYSLWLASLLSASLSASPACACCC